MTLVDKANNKSHLNFSRILRPRWKDNIAIYLDHFFLSLSESLASIEASCNIYWTAFTVKVNGKPFAFQTLLFFFHPICKYIQEDNWTILLLQTNANIVRNCEKQTEKSVFRAVQPFRSILFLISPLFYPAAVLALFLGEGTCDSSKLCVKINYSSLANWLRLYEVTR